MPLIEAYHTLLLALPSLQSYHGMTFKKAALKLWEEEQVILIGLRFPNHEDAKQR